jgi:hypothetical protein
MKTFITASVGWVLLLGIFGLYAYGLTIAIQLTWTGNISAGKYPEALSTAVNAVQALLLTNLGLLLGISVTKPNSPVARALMLQSATPKQGEGDLKAAASVAPPDPLTLRDQIQMAALAIYIIGLIACAITWIHNDFTSDSSKSVDVVTSSGKMLIGVAITYVTAVLKK